MKMLVPYVTAGVTENWTDLLRAAVDAGADAIEVGLPFSDPTMDGPVIQQASYRALCRGVHATGILDEVSRLDLGVPLIAFAYTNLVLHRGAGTFCAALRDAGVTGLIAPDLPIDEAGPVSLAAEQHGVDVVLLASPSTPARRRAEIAKRSQRFVYAVSVMAPTGEQASLRSSGRELVTSLKQHTDLPVLLGFGISGAEQAAAACAYADGVVVGSAIMRRVLDGAAPAEIGALLAGIRRAVDG
ncbi:tryptophan synthase subunit alpha [Actinoplanes aureus]|jgi:tryptophan synthase alpha chain|uniref:Tryptophan synthase alpha chain n=1 Tax=Actinoplanes aureus TaxID=2792083 RepID=A0A931FYE7_9ACTN|nr:tryptophan synthase subunit alpha [Actinoplanes aureus]MBG0563697.1 tryptophan synthase subunit alpha [Actinoplanes aureus]